MHRSALRVGVRVLLLVAAGCSAPSALQPASADPDARARTLSLSSPPVGSPAPDAWQRLRTRSLAEVPDVSSTPLVLPAEITAAELATMAALYGEAQGGGGGARTGRALRKIDAMGFAGVWFLIDRLRAIDYRDHEGLQWAQIPNLCLTDITCGVHAGFVPVADGPEPGKVDPRLARWDAETVAVWCRGAELLWPTKARFDEFVRQRKAECDAEPDR